MVPGKPELKPHEPPAELVPFGNDHSVYPVSYSLRRHHGWWKRRSEHGCTLRNEFPAHPLSIPRGKILFVRVYLVRHGQTEWNVAGRAQGHTDIPLNSLGIEQAFLLGNAFGEIPISHLYTSDLKRAHETAKAIAKVVEVEPTIRTDLRERCFGDWEGLPYEGVLSNSEAHAKAHNTSPFHFRPPNGESLQDLWERVGLLVESIDELHENVAIVTHGGTCGALLARFIKAPVESIRSFRFGNTAITELTRRPDGFYAISRYNDTHHLLPNTVAIGTDGKA